MHNKTHMDIRYTPMELYKTIKHKNNSRTPIESLALSNQRTLECLQLYSSQWSENPICHRRNTWIVNALPSKHTRTQYQTSCRNQQPTKSKKKIEETVAVWPITSSRWKKLKPPQFLYRACQRIISGWLFTQRHLLRTNLLITPYNRE
jgi:hypothetical protein